MLGYIFQTLAPAVLAVYAVYFILSGIWTKILRPAKPFVRAYGKWAVVTGSTDGIGQAMALELARKGMNIVLLSRTQTKLDLTAAAIKALGREVKTYAVDFSTLDDQAVNEIDILVSNLPGGLGIWVNNVGVSYPHPEFLADLDPRSSQKLVAINIEATTTMTRVALCKMIKQKRGAIVNISSISSLSTCPLLSQYSASKAYIDKLSLGLHHEYASSGIHVQVQNPHLVTSKLSKVRRSSLTIPTPGTYARAAVRAIGYEAQTSPYWPHAVLATILQLLPFQLQGAVIRGMHVPLRKRALRKKAQAEANSRAD